MDIDKKVKELAELFSKTGRELGEIVEEQERFIAGEIRRVETAVKEATEKCAKPQMERLEEVKKVYAQRMKACNEKAEEGLRAMKIKYEEQIRNAENAKITIKKILRDCLDTDDFPGCLAKKTKEAIERRKNAATSLQDTMKDAEISVADEFKDVVKCHADANLEALSSLQKILKEIKECLS